VSSLQLTDLEEDATFNNKIHFCNTVVRLWCRLKPKYSLVKALKLIIE